MSRAGLLRPLIGTLECQQVLVIADGVDLGREGDFAETVVALRRLPQVPHWDHAVRASGLARTPPTSVVHTVDFSSAGIARLGCMLHSQL